MRFTGMSLRSFIITIVLLAAQSSSAQIDLSGEWRFALDPTNAGVTQNWYDQSLREKIKLPGILQSQGYGDEISTKTPWVLSLYDRNWFEREDYKAYTKPGNVKVPFLSQPPRHYIGPAWYQRDIEIPADWRGKRIVLYLERRAGNQPSGSTAKRSAPPEVWSPRMNSISASSNLANTA
ncbi:MAG: hypothetical protein IPG22_12685 [Acidobacteria bacterium]|nr:hypothetical protein [Acidobacteriota bacterium]